MITRCRTMAQYPLSFPSPSAISASAHVTKGGDVTQTLARCYCGWASSGGDGRKELLEMGETIDPDPDDGWG